MWGAIGSGYTLAHRHPRSKYVSGSSSKVAALRFLRRAPNHAEDGRACCVNGFMSAPWSAWELSPGKIGAPAQRPQGYLMRSRGNLLPHLCPQEPSSRTEREAASPQPGNLEPGLAPLSGLGIHSDQGSGSPVPATRAEPEPSRSAIPGRDWENMTPLTCGCPFTLLLLPSFFLGCFLSRRGSSLLPVVWIQVAIQVAPGGRCLLHARHVARESARE